MKKITSFLLLFLALWITNNSNLKAQAVVNTSVFWTTGWCTICNNINSGQYACAQGSGSPMWNNGQRTFTDPVPAGNQVTQVCATVNYVCCGLTSMTVVLNGVTVGTFNVPTGCNCSCGNCYTGTVCITNPPTYNYGGNNTIQVVNNGGNTCVNSVQLAITYQQACNNAITNNNISSNQTICSNNLAAMLSGSLPGGGNGTYAYQWLSSTNNSTWSNVTNATSQNYTPPTPTSTVYFRRRVFSQPGCIDTSAFIGLYIQNPIGTNTIGANQTICNSGVPAQFTGTTPTGGNGNFQYSWESSSNAITWNPITGSNSLNYQSGPISSTTYFRRIITAGVCAASTSNSIAQTCASFLFIFRCWFQSCINLFAGWADWILFRISRRGPFLSAQSLYCFSRDSRFGDLLFLHIRSEAIMPTIIFEKLFVLSGQQIGVTVCSDFLKEAHEEDKNTYESRKSTGRIHK